jgi:hypothetical protein
MNFVVGTPKANRAHIELLVTNESGTEIGVAVVHRGDDGNWEAGIATLDTTEHPLNLGDLGNLFESARRFARTHSEYLEQLLTAPR